jgi:hypothetical protein
MMTETLQIILESLELGKTVILFPEQKKQLAEYLKGCKDKEKYFENLKENELGSSIVQKDSKSFKDVVVVYLKNKLLQEEGLLKVA